MTAYIDANQVRIFAHVIFSMVLGAIIGFDREISHKPAGLRTHMFVTSAATLFVLLGIILIKYYSKSEDTVIIRSDPIRIIEAVIMGVSFLGAGTIIRNSSKGITGLTTAASLLFSAAVGICIAVSQFALAIGLAMAAVVILRLFGILEIRLMNHLHS